jgi:DNA-directed RNA polymerase subunit RPC12/RpoP
MPATRYRCAACGNLTRFDVVSDRRTRAFHHYSVGGDLVVEEEQVLSEAVVEVSCRWCGHGRAVEVLDDVPAAGGAVDQAPEVMSHPGGTLSSTTDQPDERNG